MIPPRIAKSPRLSTRSTRLYARLLSSRVSFSKSNSAPISSLIAGVSVIVEIIGCTSARAVVTTIRAESRFIKVDMRFATVSLLGLNLSCGSVSHAGNSRIPSHISDNSVAKLDAR